MALPAKISQTFLPSELFFLAEDTPITILPRQTLDSLDLIGLKTPKLKALQKVEVPLWIAGILKEKARCNIIPPDWLQEKSLKQIYEEELHDSNQFSDKLPWQWLEIGQAILDLAKDDLGVPVHVIRNLLRDIREIRQAKARSGIKELNESHMRMDNLSLMEINEIRPFVGTVMDQLRELTATRNGGAGPEDAEEIDDEDEEEF